MEHKASNHFFNNKNASSYDTQRAKLAPIKDTLHLCIRMLLSDLPENAHILCVGVGTGSELIYLAEAYPKWHFTAVEPAAAMLDICRHRVEELGFTSRCTFHEGYLDTLTNSAAYDAATCLLVSHFIVDAEKRSQFFSDIATRLHPGAYMVNADLAANMSSTEYKSILEVWLNMHQYAEMPVHVDSFGHKVALIAAEKVASLIESCGFESPVLFFQTLFIHAWFSKVRS